jgi:glycosyltransferase involved in cell wall biosynthesis
VTRVAVVPPVPMPYREPLFAALAAQEGIDLRVIYQAGSQPGWDAPQEWFPERHDYPAEHLRAWQRSRPGRTPVVWPRGLERALSRFGADAVVAWEYGPTSLRTLAWCRARRRGYAIFSELTEEAAAPLGDKQLKLHRLVAGQADACIAASSRAGERFRALGVPAERVFVSVQSADVARLREIERPPGADMHEAADGGLPAAGDAMAADGGLPAAGDAMEAGGGLPAASDAAAGGDRAATGGGAPVRFLSVGRLVPDKNHARVIDAFAAAGLGAGQATLELHGTGPLRAELEARAERVGVDVRFAGHTDTAQLPEAYARADAFVLASTYEPFGVVVREAAAAALPIVCSRVAGAAGDVAVEGDNALLVDPRDTGAIATALRTLAGDPALRARLGARGRVLEEQVARDGVTAFAAAARLAAARRGRA